MEFKSLKPCITEEEMRKVFHSPEVELTSVYATCREAKVGNVTTSPRAQAPDHMGLDRIPVLTSASCMY